MSVVLKLFFFFNFNSISSANTSLRWLISHPPKKTENKNGQGNVCCRTNGNKVWYVKMFKWNVTFFHPPSSATWTAQERRRINWAWRRQATLGFSSGNNQINASNQVINAGDGWWKVVSGGAGVGCSHSDVASSMADVRYCWLDDLCHRSCHAVISQIGAVVYIDATLPQSLTLTPNLNVVTFKIMTSHF